MTNEAPRTDETRRPPGTCLSWKEARERYGAVLGDEEQIERIWHENDAEAYDYYWQCLLSF